MGKPYTGGCACGAIRYAISGEPMVSNDCQCRDCQRESGTGHGSHLTFARAGVTVTGEATHWDMVCDSGNVKTRAFCPVCGSPIFMTFAAMPDVFTIRAASLDDPGAIGRSWCFTPCAATLGIVSIRTCRIRAHAADVRRHDRACGSSARMASYNAWNGTPMSIHPVLNDVVNEQWDANVISSDGGAVTNLVKWHKRYTTQEQAVAATLKAGINQYLARWSSFDPYLIDPTGAPDISLSAHAASPLTVGFA
jgi:hypothetical protein